MSNKTCPVLIDIRFDDAIHKAIQDIKNIVSAKNIGWITTLIGHLGLIFAGGVIRTSATKNIIKKTATFQTIAADSNQVAWTIFQTNWEYFFKSFSVLDAHDNNQISKIAFLQYLRSSSSPKEKMFWGAICNGCKVNTK